MKRIFLLILAIMITGISTSQVRLMTYNIKYANENDGENSWSQRKDWLANQIAFHDPDIFGVQEAFADAGAVQCGFCTPGLIVATHDLLARNPSPNDAEIREALEGNLCRCTGYQNIVKATMRAAELRRDSGGEQP